jgi:Leucine-rich repeat (LRR) protein
MDDSECFCVGDLALSFASSNDVRVESGVLEVEVAAVPPAEALPGLLDLTDWQPQPVLRISGLAFPTPECRVVHHIGRHQRPSNPNIWLDGFATSLQFRGEIVVHDGLLTVRGGLYEDDGTLDDDAALSPDRIGESTPLLVRRRFTPAPVDPAHFRHDSLESALSVEPDFVRVLELSAGQKPLPRELFSLTALRQLFLTDLVIEPTEPGFAALRELEWLSLKGGQMPEMPASIAQLAQLQTLVVNHTDLRSVPAVLFRMPQLETLDLQYNRLQGLPEVGAATGLRTLALKGNKFKTLPTSLKTIKGVQIEAKFKSLYQETGYGTGQAFNPKLYAAAEDAAWRKRLDAAIEREGLKRYANPIRQLARKGVAFATTAADDYALVGATRFGGEPDLPPHSAYPQRDGEDFVFLAQIDLAEIAHLQEYLPRDGLLSFFASDLGELAEARVLHHAAGTALRRTAPPTGEPLAQGPFDGFRADASGACSLPSLYGIEPRLAPGQRTLLEIDEDESLHTAYERLCISLAPNRTAGKSDVHGINRHVFTQGESMEELAAQKLGGDAADWAVLLTLGFDRNTDFCFWDAGTLTFLIHKRDLAASDFSRVVAMIESS